MDRYRGIPDITYGTAFAFDQSTVLVEAALSAGFRGIDTAGSAGAYREKLVGDAIKKSLVTGDIKRNELYIQTKFSPYKEGKDPKLYPYDAAADIATRVKQSIDSSLENLGVDYIDCLVLHSMCPTVDETIQTWREMEKYVPSTVSALGMSNTDLATLRTIYEVARVKPANVQNRLTEDNVTHEPNPAMPPGIPYPEDSYDRAVRQFCHKQDIVYTPWGILWGNPTLMEKTEALATIAQKVGVSKQIALFGGLRSLPGNKVSILCGTKQTRRMRDTIEGLNSIQDFILQSERNRVTWEEYVKIIWSILEGCPDWT